MRPAPERITRLPEQAFTSMLAAAAAAREMPSSPAVPFIDLGRGNPDIPPPVHALDALRTADVHGYPPFQGEPALRAAIAARYLADHDVVLDPDTEVAVVPGTKTGIMLACLAAAQAGDAVALPDPGYPDYRSGVALAGAREVALPLDAAGVPDLDVVDEETALVVLNYPSNPTARCEPPGTFEAAVDVCARRGSWLLHDLAYGFLAFDGRRARSVLEADGARELAVELWSPSKVFGMAGWRVGFLVGNADLVGRVKALVDHVTAGVYVGLQRGLCAALTGPRDDEHARAATYRARRDRLAEALGMEPPEGTFYAWWPLPEGVSVERAALEARVGIAPGTAFGPRGAGFARLSLALPDRDLDEALARLAPLARLHAG